MSGPEEVERIEREIAELKKWWPKHSAPPGLYDELESLEEELEKAVLAVEEEDDGREARRSRLSKVRPHLVQGRDMRRGVGLPQEGDEPGRAL